MRGFIAETGRAVAFLSRLPVPDSFFPEDPIPVSQSARAYALAGVVIALPAAMLLLVLLEAGLDPLFAAGLYLACSLLVTGGLHEDGLADCADGFGGASSRERSLEIMKDSTIGAYGGLSLAMTVLLRTAGVAAIATSVPPWASAMAVVGCRGAQSGCHGVALARAALRQGRWGCSGRRTARWHDGNRRSCQWCGSGVYPRSTGWRCWRGCILAAFDRCSLCCLYSCCQCADRGTYGRYDRRLPADLRNRSVVGSCSLALTPQYAGK